MNTSSDAGQGAETATERLQVEVDRLRSELDACSTRLHLTEKLLANVPDAVFDDGDGFQVKEQHDGLGLTGMRERAGEMGGELKIVSSRGKGTAITAILPLNSELVL
jgi:signal transduction histidine kinase